MLNQAWKLFDEVFGLKLWLPRVDFSGKHNGLPKYFITATFGRLFQFDNLLFWIDNSLIPYVENHALQEIYLLFENLYFFL